MGADRHVALGIGVSPRLAALGDAVVMEGDGLQGPRSRVLDRQRVIRAEKDNRASLSASAHQPPDGSHLSGQDGLAHRDGTPWALAEEVGQGEVVGVGQTQHRGQSGQGFVLVAARQQGARHVQGMAPLGFAQRPEQRQQEGAQRFKVLDNQVRHGSRSNLKRGNSSLSAVMPFLPMSSHVTITMP